MTVRSLAHHLRVWLLGALTLGALVIVGVSYTVTLDELDEVFDASLQDTAAAVAMHHRFDAPGAPRARGALPALPSFYDTPGHFDIVTLAWTREGRLLWSSEPAAEIPFSGRDGLVRVRRGAQEWHVYTLVLDAGVVQAAQRESSRETLAAEVALQLLLPLVALIVLTGVLLVIALRRGLAPLDRAAAGVALRDVGSVQPIELAALPREIHPFARAINDLLQRLAEAFAAQRRFVADAAHELRSPVTALRLQLQLLERAADTHERERAVGALRAGIERSQRLIEQLLDLSRTGPDAPAQHVPVELGDLVRDAVGRASVDAEHAGIDLGAEAEAACSVAGDPDQLAILLDNLVGNALRYTPRGGRVDVRAGVIGGRPALQVVDTGPGIAEGERARVFDRFYRGADLPAEQRSRGSGLGLAIVQAVAQRHGAQVALHTAPGGGLDVRVLFEADGPSDAKARRDDPAALAGPAPHATRSPL